MTLYRNNAAGGTNAATVSNANSGGTSGQPWDSVTIGTGASVTFDNTHTQDGPLAYRLATGGTAAQAALVWTTGFSDTEMWGSFYAYFSSFATASTSTACVRLRGSAAQAARIAWNASGTLRILDAATTNGVSGAVACPTNAWFRVDWHVNVVGGVGDVWLYKTNPDAAVGAWDDHISTTGASYGSNPIDEFGFGAVSNNANVGPYWVAWPAMSDVGVPGSANWWTPSNMTRRHQVGGVHRPRQRPAPSVPFEQQPLWFPPPRHRVSPRVGRGRVALAPPPAAVVTVRYPTRPVHRTRQVLGRTRGRTVTPVPLQVFQAPPFPVSPLRRARWATARTRGKAQSPVPAQVFRGPSYPITPPRRPRCIAGRIRGRVVTPVPAQVFVAPAPAIQPVRRGRAAVVRTRGRVSQPIIAQVFLAPAIAIQAVHRLRQVIGRFRGKAATVTPPQVALPPVQPAAPVHRTRQAVSRPHGKSYGPVIVQVAPLPVPMRVPAGRRRSVIGLRRRQPAQPVTATPPVVAPVRRSRLFVAPARRHPATPVPVQLAPVAPRVPQPLHRRLVAAIARHARAIGGRQQAVTSSGGSMASSTTGAGMAGSTVATKMASSTTSAGITSATDSADLSSTTTSGRMVSKP